MSERRHPRRPAQRGRRPARRAARSTARSGSPTRGADSETSAPLAHLAVRDKAVSTSGNSQRGFRIDGRWYSHKLDPRDGHARSSGSPARRSSPIGPPTPTPSPRSSTSSRPRRASAWRGRSPGVECLIVSADGRVTRSDGWGRYERPARGPLAMEQAAGRRRKRRPTPAGATRSSCCVKLEINRPNTGKRRYQRPVPRRLGRGQGRVPGPHPHALGHGEPSTARNGSPT